MVWCKNVISCFFRRYKYTALSFVILIFSCEYGKGKLAIQNYSNNDICYQTLILRKGSKVFYQVSAGGEIKVNGLDHPIVRRPLSNEIDEYSSDKILYIVFYRCSEQEFVYQNIGSIVYNKDYVTKKYFMKDLDSLNWLIKYKEK